MKLDINTLIKNNNIISQEVLEDTINESLKKIDMNLNTFRDVFPKDASKNNVYEAQPNDTSWTQSFWTGMVWHAYELTGDEKYLELGQHHTESFKNRIDKKLSTDTHDLGFLYTLSCVADYKITKNEVAKETALKAAEALMLRWKEKGEFIQAWGSIHDKSNYRLIIDCYLNLPLLFWATEVTGDKKYAEVATKHAKTARQVVVRDDNSTYHTYYFDPETGKPTKGVTVQGYADDSCWSRGQAWAIYGFALCYKYTKDATFLDYFKRVTDYFIDHLPKDYVSYWDLYFTEGDEEKDSSATAIAVCGILEGIKYLEDEELVKHYILTALKMTKSLIDNYTAFKLPKANGLLLHGVYSKPGNNAVDEMQIWGDYFFMEILSRLKGDWRLYW